MTGLENHFSRNTVSMLPTMTTLLFALICTGAIRLTAAQTSLPRATRSTLICNTTSPAEPIVSTQNGTVAGYHIPSYSQDAFLGIPFAEPPVGHLRFRAPQPPSQVWNSTFEAKTYPPKCVGYGSEQIGDFDVAEDCLYLNVVRPACAENLPVAVWIHGGGE